MSYLFVSERLGFRTWEEDDVSRLFKINTNPEAMKFFPEMPDLSQTRAMIERMKTCYLKNGYCYFPVEKLDDHSFIGFIGLYWQTLKSPFTPAVDIGWRLHPDHWGQGYATEGAKRCLNWSFEELQLSQVISMAPKLNRPSIRIMEKIGMRPFGEFEFEGLGRLKEFVVYRCDHPKTNG